MRHIRILKNSLSNAFKSLFRNFSLGLASVSCIFITLMLVAIALILSKNVNNFTRDIENDLTIVTALKNIVVPYGVIHSKEEGKISSMEEKPKLSYFVNTGMYVLSPKALERIPKDTFFHMTDLADMLLQEGEQVGMYPISEESFLDMGEFEEMHRMEQKLHIKAE